MNETDRLPHDTDPQLDLGSLVAGLLFTVLGVAFVLEASGRWDFELGHFRFLGPLVLIVIGITTLVGASMSRGRY